MMITIHGFPAKTKYQDVKMLIKQECNISDFILDNLLSDADGTKKVRIGLTDNAEGFKVMKFLDGYRMPGNFILKAVPIGKAASNQPPQESSFDSRPSYQSQPRNDYSNVPRNDYMSQAPNDYNSQGSHGPGAPHSHGGIHGSVGSHGPVSSHGPRPSQGGPHSHGGPHVSGGPQGTMDNRPSPWVSGGGNSSSQWNTPMATQVPQNTFGFTSPQGNVNPSYGQQPHQSHPRPGFNQGRATEQGYGYTPKNVPEVPANSRYRWVKNAAPEPKVSKTSHPDEDSPKPSSVENFDENSQDLIDHLDKVDPGEASKTLDPSESKPNRKARKREENRLRNKARDISNLNGAQRRRLWFWTKRGKTFMEARELCKTRLNQIEEYPAARAEKKKKAREVALRRMSPESQARAMKVDRLKGRGNPEDPPPVRTPDVIRARILDELGLMSQEKIDMLQDKILELVDAETDGNGPSFVGCSSRSGCLILTCANTQTFEWLENHLPDFQLWEGAKVKIINLNELPKPVIGVAYIADPDLDDEAILRMLKSQNKGIDFSDWWITSKKPEQPAGQTITFSIDKESVEKLAERNNFVYLGLKKTKIRLRSKNAKAPPGQGMMPPMKQMGQGKMNKPPNPPMGQKSKGPRGKMGMPPKWQKGVAPMDQMSMGPMGPMGMGPMGPIGPMGMGPMGPMGMGPIGPMGMGPMGMGPMDPMGMGSMGPMGMGPFDPMGMAPMGQTGFVPAASNSAETFGYSQPKHFGGGNQQKHFGGGNRPKHFGGGNQPKHFGGGNQPKYFGGGNQPKYFGARNQPKKFGGGEHPINNEYQSGPDNNGGPNPNQGNPPKKLSPSKAKRNKERMMGYLGNQGKNKNQGKGSWKKPKDQPPY